MKKITQWYRKGKPYGKPEEEVCHHEYVYDGISNKGAEGRCKFCGKEIPEKETV